MKNLTNHDCERYLVLWESIATTINHVQAALFDHENDNRYDNKDVFRLILEASEATAFGLPKKDFFIVRRPYGDERLGLVVDKGELQNPPGLLANEKAGTVGYEQSVLAKINDILSGKHKKNTGQEYLILNDFQATGLDSFVKEYRSLLIVPMRLYKNKFTGVFVFGSQQAGAFSDRQASALDTASDRVSTQLRVSDDNLRSLLLKEYQFQAVAKGRFDKEQAVIEMAVKYLTCSLGTLKGRITFETQPWFRSHEVNIIIRDPIQPSTFYWACKAGVITDGRPASNGVSESDFSALAGTLSKNSQGVLTPILLQNVHLRGEPIFKNSQSECAEYFGADTQLQSWIAAPMQISSQGIIGYFILQNKVEQRAYASESDLLDQFSDFTASMLRNIRNHRRDAELNNFRQVFKNKKYANDTPDEYINRCMDCLVSVYGDSISMRIVLRNRLTGMYEVKASSIASEISEVLNDALIDKINEFVLHPNSLPKDISVGVVGSLKNYLLIPLKRMTPTDFSIAKEDSPDYINIGCLVIQGQQIGESDRQYIDNITNLLALKIHQTEEKARQEVFDAFNKKIEVLHYDELTEHKLLDLVKEITGKIMFTDNLFVALLDQSTNAIRFPLLMKGGQHNVESQKKVEHDRFLDINSSKKARTEVILTNREPIFIESKKASFDWYEQDGHIELMDDPLASWIGVPIISDNKALGVIATYHETVDFLYTSQSVKFLQRVAAAIVPLLVLQRLNESIKNNTELKKANEKLEESIRNNTELRKANEEIAKKEAQLASSLMAQDLTHRLNNSLGSISINIEQSVRDVKKATDTKNCEYLEYTHSSLGDAKLVVDGLIGDIADITSSKESEFLVNELINRLLQQVLVELRLDDHNVSIKNTNKDNQLKLNMVYRFVSNCLHSLIFNAAEALVKKAKQEKENQEKEKQERSTELYLIVDVSQESGFVYIDVTDNGVPIPAKLKSSIFEYGISSQNGQVGNRGYGLWRAKSLMRSYDGDIQLIDTKDETKKFRLIAKQDLVPGKLLAYVVDDERSWRNILKRWLQEMKFDVETAANSEEATILINNEGRQPDLVLLDIALDSTDGANSEGLMLISKIRGKYPLAKIALVSGYLEKASNYVHEVDFVLDKIGDKGVLTLESLRKSVTESMGMK